MGRLVAIVGRPNVGKSTLFNRLTQTRAAIVNDTSGTTRDRQYGKMEWNGMEMSVVDTGGWVVNSEDIFEEEINKQVHLAIDEADVILFVVDIKNGITDLDDHVADILRRTSKPVIVVISAVNGNGTGDLLDEVVKQMPEKAEETIDEELPRFAIVGRPNAGKSSLVNSLMDEQRNIVTDIAGTTRDSIYSRYNKFGFDFYLVDTAGIRKKNKVNEDIEYYSVLRSIRAIENSDNKWDVAENKTQQSISHFEATIRERFAPFTDFPIIFGSALTKQRIHKVLQTAIDVYNNRRITIPTSQLNNLLQEDIQAFPPPAVKGKYIKIKYITMLKGAHVPTFIFFCNLPQWIKDPYKRYLENKIREHWNLHGTIQ